MELLDMKTCGTCKCEKAESEFYYRKDRDSFNSQCKECKKEYAKLNADRIRMYVVRHRAENKEIVAKKAKVYHLKNRDTRIAKMKEYAKENKERLQKQNQKWKNEKYKSCPLFALQMRIKNLVNASFRKCGYSRKSRIQSILGCSYEEFRAHISSLFAEGMSWDNRSAWHIDHHIPIASAKTEDELLLINHYKNLKPMWALDNILKRDSMPESILTSEIA